MLSYVKRYMKIILKVIENIINLTEVFLRIVFEYYDLLLLSKLTNYCITTSCLKILRYLHPAE